MEDHQHLPGKRSFRIPIELLDEFDEVWFTDSVPLIESFLGRVPAESQPDLLMELLAIEWEHRRKKGHHFSFREYLTRFPESAAWLQKHWREFSGSVDGESEIGKPEGPKKKQTDQEIENSRFRIDGIWARGGIGEVLLAWDRSLARQVAVKIIQARIADNEEVRRRFRREAEVIGKLEHPGIIPIYAYGYFENGEPYYAMRLVKDGETLESRIQKAHQISIDPESPTRSAENWERLSSPGVTLPGSLSIAETIDSSDSPTELVSLGEARRRKIRPVSPDREMSTIETRFLLEKFLSLTDAVAFAHSQGVIHRDIKPGNVILGPFGETFLVDWGLALVKNEILAPGEESSEFGSFGESTYRAGSTKPGRFIGTPSYCAPEQAMGLPCNDSCDIYSLGATLYHLMTGSPPRKDEPSNPQAIEAARANDFIPPRLVSRNLDKAMEALILKAMSTRPRDRYPSVKALSDDVRRWMADEPVSAWREPWSRWAGRLVRKHRKTAILTTVLLFLVALAGLSFREKYRELENSRILQAYQKQTFETQVAQEHYINLTHTAADLIETRSPGWSREFDEVSQSLDPIRRSHPDGIYPRFDRSKIARYSFSDLISTPKSQPINLAMTVSRIIMRPGHRQFAVAEFKLPRGTSTCRIQVVDTETRKILWKGSSRKFRLAVEQDGFRSIAFSPDGKWLAAGTRYGKAMLWKIGDLTDSDPDVDHDPDLSWTVRNGREVRKLQWSYTKDIGLRLICLHADDSVSVWRSEDLEKTAEKSNLMKSGVEQLTRDIPGGVSDLLTPPATFGEQVIFAAINGRLRKLEPATFEPLDDEPHALDLGESFVMAWHPSGSIVAAGRSSISIIDPATATITRTLRDTQIDRAHLGRVKGIQVTADGQYAVTFSNDENDRRAKLWNLEDPKDLVRLFLPGDSSFDSAFALQSASPNGQGTRIWVTDARSVRSYDLQAPALYERISGGTGMMLAMSTTGGENPAIVTLNTSDTPGQLSLNVLDIISRRDSQHQIAIPGPSDRFRLAIAPDRKQMAIAAEENYVMLLQGVPPDKMAKTRTFEAPVANAIGFDERNRLYGLFDHLATVRLVAPEATSFEGADCLSFSDISTKFSGLGSFYALTSKNGQIVAGGRDGVVRAWKTSPPPTAGIVHRIWRNGYSPVFSLALTDDARWIISGDQAGRLHLIDSESTKITPKMTFPSAHQDLVSAIAIIRRASSTNQGSIIASGSQNGALRLWSLDVTSGREQIIPLVELPPMPSPIRKLEFLSKPKLSLAVHTEGLSGLRLWSIERILELCESH